MIHLTIDFGTMALWYGFITEKQRKYKADY